MAISLTAEAIVLAINSAIKLGDRLQRAYANSIKAKAILLPLPQFTDSPNIHRAHRYFEHEEGKRFPVQFERLKVLFDTFELHGLAPEEEIEYIDYYLRLRSQSEKGQSDIADDDTGMNLDGMLALLRVRQWESGKMPCDSPVKIVAGTLVEIGIDYFNQVPGALNPQSSLGRVMKRFLSAIDDIEITETDSIKAISSLIIPRLFITAAESLEIFSKDISSDEKVQGFIAATSRGIADEVIKRTRHAADEEAVQWGELVLRSMVKNAGAYVFNAPGGLFNTNEGMTRLIQNTGNLLLEAILSSPDGLNLKEAFNIDTLDQVTRAALKVIAEHPRLIDGRDGMREIVMGVSAALAEAGLINRPHLLPDLVQLILEHTAGNFHLIVRGDTQEESKHLLVIAVQQLLLAMAQAIPDDHLGIHFPQGQLLLIAENILDEVVTNPNWVLAKTGDQPLLRATLDATFQALAAIPKEQRLNNNTLQLLIKINIRTVIANQAVLNQVKWGTEENSVTILQKALDLLFTFIFESEEVQPAERIYLLSELLRYISKVILTHHPNKRGLLLIDMILFQDPNVDYSGGFNPKFADELIEAALNVFQTHPELISRQESLQGILKGVATGLRASSFRKAGLLPELARLILNTTAGNVHLIVRTETGKPEYLLVLALQQILTALSVKSDENDHWQPRLTATQLINITENVFDQVVHHPQWLTGDEGKHSLFGSVIHVIFGALREIPEGERLQAHRLELIIQLGLGTAISHPQLLNKIHWGEDEEEVIILQHALRLTIAFVFERTQTQGGQRLELFTNLLHFVLEMLMARHPDKKGLLLLDLVLFEDPDVDYSRGFQPELYESLITAAIRVLDYRPDLVTKDAAFQHIIEGVMGALKASGFRRRGLLTELIRLTLECTAENVHLIVSNPANGRPRYLLVVALQSLLRHLSAPPEANDRWQPGLNAAQMLDIVEEVLDYLVRHPHLVTTKIRQGTIFSETLNALFAALARLPKDYRLQPAHLEWLLQTALRSAATSQALLRHIKWGPDEEEAVILEKALDLVFTYVFPPEGPTREEKLEALLEYVLEFVLRHHQDKKALLLLYLILFEYPELGRSPLPKDQEVEDLVQAALLLLAKYPELISRDAVWQKIIQDTARALRDSKLGMPELLPELLRLTLLYTAENVDLLTKVNPSSRQYVLTVAMEQVLRAVAEKPKRGTWKPQLSNSQILDILELCLELMIQNPLWVKDKMLQLVLTSLFEAMQSVPEERKLPYTTIRMLIENGLKAVSFRKNLVLEIVHKQGRRQVVALTYALEGLFVTLYQDEDAGETASWTLTQTNILDAILDSFLLGLVEGPITKEAINEALLPVKTAMQDLADNAAFTLEDLLDELER